MHQVRVHFRRNANPYYVEDELNKIPGIQIKARLILSGSFRVAYDNMEQWDAMAKIEGVTSIENLQEQ